jgi:hypothetical protein
VRHSATEKREIPGLVHPLGMLARNPFDGVISDELQDSILDSNFFLVLNLFLLYSGINAALF